MKLKITEEGLVAFNLEMGDPAMSASTSFDLTRRLRGLVASSGRDLLRLAEASVLDFFDELRCRREDAEVQARLDRLDASGPRALKIGEDMAERSPAHQPIKSWQRSRYDVDRD